MKAITDFRHSRGENISEYATRKKCSLIKRILPFVLLSLFLILWLLNTLVAGAGAGIKIKIILFPFLLMNIVFADFATWNYLAGKKEMADVDPGRQCLRSNNILAFIIACLKKF